MIGTGKLAVLVCAVRLPHAPATPSCRSHRPALEIDSAEPPEARQVEERRYGRLNLLDRKAYIAECGKPLRPVRLLRIFCVLKCSATLVPIG